MSTIKVNRLENTSTANGGIDIDASGHVQFDGLQMPTAGAFSNRNKIINGAMVIDQRNAGASVTPANTYTLDRWQGGVSQTGKFSVQQNAGSITPPTGFKNYLGVTSLSAYSVLAGDYFVLSQRIEGYNFSDLMFGTASAQPFIVSFWVRSSLTGVFGGSFQGAQNSTLRSYPFSYTIAAANTWEYKTVAVAADTFTNTWENANGIGLYVNFGLGAGSNSSGTAGTWASANYASATGATSVVGTNGATFYITGVQLEVGSKATPFEYRSYGDELAKCQRYYEVHGVQLDTAQNGSGTGYGTWYFKQTKRDTPSTASDTGGIKTGTNVLSSTGWQIYQSAGALRMTVNAFVSSEL